MAPMKATMKAVKKTKAKSTAMTASAIVAAMAEATGIKAKEVKAVVEQIVSITAAELKKHGAFKFAGIINLRIKNKPATPARKGLNPFTKEPMVFKAKPASKNVRALAMKKLKDLIN